MQICLKADSLIVVCFHIIYFFSDDTSSFRLGYFFNFGYLHFNIYQRTYFQYLFDIVNNTHKQTLRIIFVSYEALLQLLNIRISIVYLTNNKLPS